MRKNSKMKFWSKFETRFTNEKPRAKSKIIEGFPEGKYRLKISRKKLNKKEKIPRKVSKEHRKKFKKKASEN